ncbi:MAG: TetR/AcrR family transcriptional regulator [Cyclobacteriaceae bacterium]|nr:TetR/AcrR family transcriptional regulator [Cyclobacteriaceae bacterium]
MEEKDIKERILRGAQELFMKYGVRSVSMDDIARHLSVSKKTLYQYFADKDEIVTMVAEFHLRHEQQQYETLRSSAENAIDELVKISTCIKRDLQKMNPSLLFDLQKYHPKAWNVWLGHKQQYMGQSIIRNLKQGIAEGFFRPEINTDILAASRLELIQITFNEEVFPSEKYNLAEVNHQIFEHFVYGVLTDKGRKVYEKYKQQPTTHLELISPIL